MFRSISAFLICCCFLNPPAFAYDTDLSDTAVREAYFLGQRGDEKTRAFFALYTKRLPLPNKGPYISEIRLFTPRAQVVQVSSEHTSGYSAQQAHIDYRGRGDSLLLMIHIEFTATYGPIDASQSSTNAAGEKGLTLRTEDFWQDFRFGLRQKEDWIEPRSVHGEPQYDASDGTTGTGGLVGAWVYVEYDARNISSDDTEIQVVTPDDHQVTVNFDLAKLH